MKLNELKPARGAVKKRKRLGCGTGSGRGGTCTKGHKGQKCRSGGGTPPWFEGGQMPLQRRVPKRGFTNPTRKCYQVINVCDLARFDTGSTVGLDELRKAGLIKQVGVPVKLLGNGTIDQALTVKVHAASKSAVEKIDQSNGKVEILSKG
ncbi:MAG: 50S ribosomal protein L15 [Candidatus Eisenbacteria sp.]|nr:50S ribosomal protein L15 [Candidatus Eisenbacteria bacterium]